VPECAVLCYAVTWRLLSPRALFDVSIQSSRVLSARFSASSRGSTGSAQLACRTNVRMRTSCLAFGAVDAAALPALQGAAGSLQQVRQGRAFLLVMTASFQRVYLTLHSKQSFGGLADTCRAQMS
jgi:hypothetical protein